MTVAQLKQALAQFPDDLDVRLDHDSADDFEPLVSVELTSSPYFDYGEFVCLSESRPRPRVPEPPMDPLTAQRLREMTQTIGAATLEALGANLQQARQISREYDSVMSG